MDRRKLLSTLGLVAVGAFTATVILPISQARASGDGSSGGGDAGGASAGGPSAGGPSAGGPSAGGVSGASAAGADDSSPSAAVSTASVPSTVDQNDVGSGSCIVGMNCN